MNQILMFLTVEKYDTSRDSEKCTDGLQMLVNSLQPSVADWCAKYIFMQQRGSSCARQCTQRFTKTRGASESEAWRSDRSAVTPTQTKSGGTAAPDNFQSLTSVHFPCILGQLKTTLPVHV